MIEPPPRFSRCGIAALQPAKVVRRLFSSWPSHPSWVMFVNGLPRPPRSLRSPFAAPALLTKTSTPAEARHDLCGRLRRGRFGRHVCGDADCSTPSDAAVFCASATSTSTSASFAPSAARQRAMPAPMPRAPPVTIATFPASFIASPPRAAFHRGSPAAWKVSGRRATAGSRRGSASTSLFERFIFPPRFLW